jgi:quinol monooxygenase YgiN
MTFVVAAIWKAKPGEEQRIREVIKTMTTLSRKEPGNVYYQAQVSTLDPAQFFLYEQYTNAQAFEEHRATEYFQKYIINYAIQYLESREVRTYETIDD